MTSADPKGRLGTECSSIGAVPTVADRIAQTAVKMWLEPRLDPIFHDDSYGYRPGKSALDGHRCYQTPLLGPMTGL